MRLIDADALEPDADYDDGNYWAVSMGQIQFAPTIDPFRKGKWIIYIMSMLDGEDCKCSECGQKSCAPYWNFCPNCGSRMEGCEQE